MLTSSLAQPGPLAVERLAEAGGRQVPVRIIAPEGGEIRAVYLWTSTAEASTSARRPGAMLAMLAWPAPSGWPW
jgi:hypothetical protein